VEFALIAPIFFLLVFGMIEFGRMVMVQQILTNAAREGARLAVLDSPTPVGGDNGPVASAVQSYLQTAGISGANVAINPPEPTTAGYGAPITVTVSVPFSNVSWLPVPMFISPGRQLTASVVMRRETVQ